MVCQACQLEWSVKCVVSSVSIRVECVKHGVPIVSRVECVKCGVCQSVECDKSGKSGVPIVSSVECVKC